MSRSVIAKQEQTISREGSPLILLKLYFDSRCAPKNLGVVLCELSPRRKNTSGENIFIVTRF